MYEQDHDMATVKQREEFHKYCISEQFCKYHKWVKIDEKKPEDFIWSGDRKKKRGGLLAPRDKNGILLFEKFPTALPKILKKFEICIKDSVLRRSTQYITQNANESGHGVIWNNFLKKSKRHSKARIRFGCRLFSLRHNFGIYKSSLHHKFGTMTAEMKRYLKLKDNNMLRSAAHRWIPTPTRFSTHRKQYSSTSKLDDGSRLSVENIHDKFNQTRSSILSSLVTCEDYSPGRGDGPSETGE